MTHTPAGAALTELTLEVFRLNGDLLRAGDRLAEPAGQTSSRWQVLGAIASGPRTVSAIAREMGLTRQSVQRTADLLEADGLVAGVDNPAHRRAKLVRLTRRGEGVFAELSRDQIAWVNRLAASIASGDRPIRAALEVLERFRIELEASDEEPVTGGERSDGRTGRKGRSV